MNICEFINNLLNIGEHIFPTVSKSMIKPSMTDMKSTGW